MLESPEGAFYVWPHGTSINYAINLARHLGRNDLKVIAEMSLRIDKFKGLKPLPVVVLDHATKLSEEGWKVVDYLRERNNQV